MKLTARQQEVLDYLQSEHRRSGIMPSTREIQEHFGFASQTAAVSHLRALEKKGAITRRDGDDDRRRARCLMFADAADRERILDIPVYGAIPAGYSDDTAPVADGTLSVDVKSLGLSDRAKAYALKVRGESMIDAHITDGGDHEVRGISGTGDQDIGWLLIDGEDNLEALYHERTCPDLRIHSSHSREMHYSGISSRNLEGRWRTSPLKDPCQRRG